MEKLDLTINNESESFHKIIDNIVSDFYLVILDAVQTKILSIIMCKHSSRVEEC